MPYQKNWVSKFNLLLIVPKQVLQLLHDRLAAAVKTTFDPYNIFNPDLQLGADLSQSLRHLRTHNHSGLVTP